MENYIAENHKLLEIIEALRRENAELKKIIALQAARIAELEKRLGLNSGNSSKPPSSDGFKKMVRVPRSLREPGKRNSGGQNGHDGTCLRQVSNPDVVVLHEVHSCPHCGNGLSKEAEKIIKRQVFDLPLPKIEVTEHQVEVKICPCCHKKVQAVFPHGIEAQAQYGERIKAIAVYLNNQQYIPEDRLKMLFSDLYGVQIAADTLAKFNTELSENLEVFHGEVLKHIQAAQIKHFDETGFRVCKDMHWLHVASNHEVTYYHRSKKRKSLLENVNGTIVHDHWKPYFQIEGVKHALCNAHHLRELQALIEYEKEVWAIKLRRLLLFMNKCKYKYHGAIPDDKKKRLEIIYDKIIDAGITYHENFREQLIKGRIPLGRKRQCGHNLVARLKAHKVSVLRFLHEPEVPFTNNQAEQDLRMMKVRQKISGCFRTERGADTFVRIRTFISTARKQGWDIFSSLSAALIGHTPIINSSAS